MNDSRYIGGVHTTLGIISKFERNTLWNEQSAKAIRTKSPKWPKRGFSAINFATILEMTCNRPVSLRDSTTNKITSHLSIHPASRLHYAELHSRLNGAQSEVFGCCRSSCCYVQPYLFGQSWIGLILSEFPHYRQNELVEQYLYRRIVIALKISTSFCRLTSRDLVIFVRVQNNSVIRQPLIDGVNTFFETITATTAENIDRYLEHVIEDYDLLQHVNMTTLTLGRLLNIVIT